MAATITGKVFSDLSHNGRCAAGEPGIPGVFLTLSSGTGRMRAQTDANGKFSFSVGIAGTYLLNGPASRNAAGTPPAHKITVTDAQLSAGEVLSGFDVPYAPASADLSAAVSAWPTPVWAGRPIVYTVTVQNLGPSDAQNVMITDTIPGSVRFVCCSRDNGTTWNPWPGALALGTLAAGATAVLLLEGTAWGCPAGGIVNTVSVSSATDDPNPDNNTASVTTAVLPPCGRGSTLVPDSYSQRFGRYLSGNANNSRINGMGCAGNASNSRTNGMGCAGNASNSRTNGMGCAGNASNSRTNGMGCAGNASNSRTNGMGCAGNASNSRTNGMGCAGNASNSRTNGMGCAGNASNSRTNGMGCAGNASNSRTNGMGCAGNASNSRTNGMGCAGNANNSRTSRLGCTRGTRSRGL